MDGLWLLLIILITASLSSKINKRARVGWDMIDGFLCGFECFWFELTRKVSPCRFECCNPSILRPASKDITSASLLLCHTAVCFLHDHEFGTKCLASLASNNVHYSSWCGVGVCQFSSEICVFQRTCENEPLVNTSAICCAVFTHLT